MHSLTLSGCTPVPLAHYLKALGILRLVAEQVDPRASGRWHKDQFELTSTLDEAELTDFFLNHYAPTSVLAPWNGGSGFFPKDNTKALDAIRAGEASRTAPYREAITCAHFVVARMSLGEKPTPEEKAQLLLLCRNTLPESALAWLDAAYVLTDDGAKYPPLLGTGGNDGRLEFTNNFMQRLCEVFDPKEGASLPKAKAWLRGALFSEAAATPLSKSPVGQFFPGAAGGANGTSGFDAPSAVNPWDFILMIEGALLFAAASVKRLEASSPGVLVYPFCVKQSGVGYGSATTADESASRAEMWLPLWDKPCTLSELQAVLSEGRAQVGGRPARNGVDFARAVVTLGVDRGISAFQRYGFQVRNGLSYFATPLGRVSVKLNTRASLLGEIDPWLDRLRRACGATAKPSAPASVCRALNQLESRILDLCKDDSAARLQAVLIALGCCEQAIARSSKWAEEAIRQPLAGLSQRWFTAADTRTAEFHLAASLASITGKFKDTWLPFRCHLEPLTSLRADGFQWAKNESNNVQWTEASLPTVLNDIFARRLILAEQAGTGGLPDTARYYAGLSDIKAFIEGDTDDQLLSDLIWGLSLLKWSAVETQEQAPGSASPPALYALLKLCFLPGTGRDQDSVPLVPAIHHQAARGAGAHASTLAVRRLRGSGIAPALQSISLNGAVAERTAAALLFPLPASEFKALRRLVQRPVQTENESNNSTHDNLTTTSV